MCVNDCYGENLLLSSGVCQKLLQPFECLNVKCKIEPLSCPSLIGKIHTFNSISHNAFLALNRCLKLQHTSILMGHFTDVQLSIGAWLIVATGIFRGEVNERKSTRVCETTTNKNAQKQVKVHSGNIQERWAASTLHGVYISCWNGWRPTVHYQFPQTLVISLER